MSIIISVLIVLMGSPKFQTRELATTSLTFLNDTFDLRKRLVDEIEHTANLEVMIRLERIQCSYYRVRVEKSFKLDDFGLKEGSSRWDAEFVKWFGGYGIDWSTLSEIKAEDGTFLWVPTDLAKSLEIECIEKLLTAKAKDENLSKTEVKKIIDNASIKATQRKTRNLFWKVGQK